MLPLNQIKLIVIAVAIATAFGMGWKVHSWKTDAAEKKLLEQQLELQKAYDTLSREVVIAYNRQEAKEKIVYRTLKQEIPNVTDNRICFADGAALGVWNNALSGVPSTSAGTTKAPSATDTATDAEVLANVIENFEQYKAVRNQLNSLIDWYELSYNIPTEQ